MRMTRSITDAVAAMTMAALAVAPGASAEPVLAAVDGMDAAVRAAAGLAAPMMTKKAKVTPLRTDEQGRVTVYVEGDDADSLARNVTSVGGIVSNTNRYQVRAAVPPNMLEKLAGSTGVREVRRPDTPVEMEIISEEVQPSGALAWQSSGQQGAGVKVGIIDVGFGRLDDAQANGEVPANTTVNNGLCPAEQGSSHGTTMAEVVHDMAPQAQLYLACVTDSMDFDDAARWLKDSGVAVVNVALGFPGTGRGNGAANTGQAEWTPATTVAFLRENGIVVVAAAGNEADKHMTGLTVDPENNGWMNVSGAAENQGFSASVGKEITVELKWDRWQQTNDDLDLFVMDQLGKPTGLNDPHLVTYSVRPQKETAGGLSPVETLTFTSTAASTCPNPNACPNTYWIYVQRKDGAATDLRYDLTIYGDVSGVQFVDRAGSIAEPATSPYAIAVGAITPANAASGAVEGYSSRGPTIDGRIKPDVIAYTNVSTLTGGTGRGGTSVAAAHVTGAAALYKGANPTLDPAQLEALLLDSSNRPTRDNDFGYGVLNLGSPRVPQPPAGNAFTPLSTIRRVLDRQLQPDETFTLRIPDLPSDTSAVMIDLTAVPPLSGDTRLEVFADTPTGTPSLHAEKDRYSSTFLTAALHPVDKVVRIKNTGTAVHVIIDLYGYYSEQSASTYFPKSLPFRLLDTRTWGTAAPKLDPNEEQTIKVRDVAGVPANATAVLVEVTATDATDVAHFELYAQNVRTKWTLTTYPGEERQTLTMVPIADDGTIRIQNHAGSAHAIVDLVGWYATGGAGARYIPFRHVLPAFDSRTGTSTSEYPFGPADTRVAPVRRLPRVPYNASAVMLATTLQQSSATTRAGLSCLECGWRGHANITAPAARARDNAVVLPMGASGWLSARNDRGTAQLSATISGYFTGGAPVGDTPPPTPTGYWKFDEGTGNTVADSSGNNRTATMAGNVSWVGGRPGSAGSFDGSSGYATTAGPVLRTDQSFSVAAWVYLNRNDTWYTAIAQDGGTQQMPFVLQYSKSLNRWAFDTMRTDTVGPQEVWAAASTPATVGQWTHLVGVYDAAAHDIRLYVNGARDGLSTGATIWRADGPFTVGRTKYNGTYVQNFAGAVDEVRTYDRALTDSDVRELHRATPAVTMGEWKFDEGSGTIARDTSWRKIDGTLSGGVSWTAGVSGQAVSFNGGSASIEMPSGVVSADSFTVTAWVRQTATALWRDVATQSGNRRSAFALTSAPGGQWMFGATAGDDDGSAFTTAVAEQPVTVNEWVHLAGVYDAAARQVRLYINGKLVGLTDGATVWNATGGFAVGRGKWQGNPTDFFAGSIDDVHTYQGILSEEQIHALATR